MENKALRNILITGSNGLLGQKLIDFLSLKNTYNIYGVSRGENRIKNIEDFTYYHTDLTDPDKLTSLIDAIQPEVIFNTAAMTNVDQCELDHKACDKINVEMVQTLADSCKRNDIHLIHLSTDFIFDGEKGYYKEEDEPNPVNYYGLSKLRSEQIVKEAGIRYTILRTILVFGLTRELKNNIVLWVINNIKNKQHINVVTDQLRMPTLVDDLAHACIIAFENDINGVFNISGNHLLSIYDIALAVAETFGLDQNFIHPIATSELSQPAKRPPLTGFDLKKSITTLKLSPVSFQESLQVFKKQLLNRDTQ